MLKTSQKTLTPSGLDYILITAYYNDYSMATKAAVVLVLSAVSEQRERPAQYGYRVRLLICTKYITLPWADFPWSISPHLEQCRCYQRSASELSRRELSEDPSCGIGTLIGCRAIELGKPPQGGWCDIHTPNYTAGPCCAW